MRIAIFASSDKLTRELLERLEPAIRGKHTLIDTVFFPSVLSITEFIKTFGLANFIKVGLEEIPTKRPTAKNPNDLAEWVRAKEIDVVLNFTGHIYKRELLDAPKICCLNKHSSLLPKYRGLFPVFWAYLNGDDIGITIHKMNERIDAGEIVLQKNMGKPFVSVYTCYQMLNEHIPAMILEALELLEPQKYYGMPTRDDYVYFKTLGHEFI